MKRLLTGISAMAIGCLAFGEFADYTIHPGNGVTATVSEKISGPLNLVVNPGNSGGGIVTLNPANDFYGTTTIGCGTLIIDTLADLGYPCPLGAPLGADGSILLGRGTLRYTGPEATVNRGLTVTGNSAVIDVTDKLTLTGPAHIESGCLFKTGPGTLFLGYPGTNFLPAASTPVRQDNITDLKANGDAPNDSLASLAVLEGTLAWGVPGQVVYVKGTDLHVGGYTSNAPGGEKPGFLDIYGGTTFIQVWLAIGRHNGNLTTAPTPMESRVRVFDGVVDITNLTVGRNKKKYAAYKMHTRPTFEVHGGTVRAVSTCRLGDDQGGNTLVRILGGSFQSVPTCNFAAISGPSTNSVEVADSGTFLAWEVNCGVKANTTKTDFDIRNGGVFSPYRVFATTGQHTLRFDGGILRPRFSGGRSAIESSIAAVNLSTNGVIIEANSATDTLEIVAPIKNAPDMQGAVDGGIVLVGNDNANLNLIGSNNYKGPTTISNGTLTVTGIYPAASPLTLESGGGLAITNASKTVTVERLALGTPGSDKPVTLRFGTKPGGCAQLLVTDSLTLDAGINLKLHLHGDGDLNAPPATGTHTILQVPAADAAALDSLEVSFLNTPPDLTYYIDTTVSLPFVVITVTVAQNSHVGNAWINPAGGSWQTAGNWSDNAAPDSMYAAADFTTDADAGGAEVTLNGNVTLGRLLLASSEPYTFTGSSRLSMDNGYADAVWNVTLGNHAMEAPLRLQGPLALDTLAGASQRIATADMRNHALRINTSLPSGGGTVTLDSLAAPGTLETGSGTASIQERPDNVHLILGPGTLHVAGGEAALWSGFTTDPGAALASILRNENDITVNSPITALSGAFIKSGAGTLTLSGPGAFDLGHLSGGRASAHNATGFPANGDSPVNSFGALTVAQGKLVWGEPGQSVAVNSLYLGARNSNEPGGATTGEIEINGGTTTVNGTFYIGVANGDPTSAPTPMRPRLTVNGGETIINGELVMGWDNRSTTTAYHKTDNAQNTQPEFVLNDGIVRVNGYFYPAYHAGVNITNHITINGGELHARGAFFGAARFGSIDCAPVIFEINGGLISLREDFRTARFGADSYVRFNGGILRAWDLQKADGNGASDIWLNGGTLQPVFTGQAAVYRTFDRHTNVWVSAGGFILDTSLWPDTLSAPPYEIKQSMQHDPALGNTPDGGFIKRGAGTIIIRPLGATGEYSFTGPVVAEEGIIGLDRNALWYNQVVLHDDTGLRLSNKNEVHIIDSLTAGSTSGGTVTLDLTFEAITHMSQPLVVSNALDIVADIMVIGHDDGRYTTALPAGTESTVLICKPGQTLDAAKFKAWPLFPNRDVTFTKTTLTSGDYAGWQAIIMTVSDISDSHIWASAVTGGDWTTDGNWLAATTPPSSADTSVRFPPAGLADVPVTATDATLGALKLEGSGSGGYKFSDGSLTFKNSSDEPALLVAPSGTHTLTTPLSASKEMRIETTGGATVELAGGLQGASSLLVNPAWSNGGKVVLDSTSSLAGLTSLRSGTLQSDGLPFDGDLTIGPATFHYTGPARIFPGRVNFSPGAERAVILRTDNDLSLAGTVNSTSGSFVKTGAGTLRIAGAGTHKLSSATYNTRWNEVVNWPGNGDSPVPAVQTGFPGTLVDEGRLVIGGAGQTVNVSGECWIGAQDRGWGYSSLSPTIDILGGTVNFNGTLSIGRNFGRAAGVDTFPTVNIYGGNVKCGHLIMAYDLAKKAHSAKATLNIFGGELTSTHEFRLGHIYGNTSNPSHSTVNVYDGILRHYYTSATKSGINFGFLNNTGEGRGGNGTLNIFGGEVLERDLVKMGQNNATARLNLHGGLLEAENIVYEIEYHAGGTAHILFNGGVFRPLGSNANSRVLQNIDTAVVSTNGAIFDTSALAGGAYTISQSLAHDSGLGSEQDGGLIKRGDADLVLDSINTFTGPVTVESGTLRATINGAIPDELRLPATGTFDADGAVRTIPRISGSGTAVNGTVRATVSVAPATTLSCDSLTLAAGVTFVYGAGNVAEIADTLIAEGGGFVDFGHELDENPLPVPSSYLIMRYGECDSDFAGWKPLGTGHPSGKVALRLVRDESGPQKAVRAELIYNGTILMLK